jgi:hypothetical protein
VTDANDKEQVRQAFARRFRFAVTELGIALHEQGRLQRLFGVSGQAVRKWIEGTAMPTPARMPAVAAVLGVRRAWLQDGEDPVRPATIVAEAPGKWDSGCRVTADEVRLLHRYRLLAPTQRQAIDVIVEAMVKLPGE